MLKLTHPVSLHRQEVVVVVGSEASHVPDQVVFDLVRLEKNGGQLLVRDVVDHLVQGEPFVVAETARGQGRNLFAINLAFYRFAWMEDRDRETEVKRGREKTEIGGKGCRER